MKLTRNLFVALAGASLAITPAYAAPVQRASQDAEDGADLSSTGWIFALAALAVAVLAVVAFNNDDDPVSP